MAGKRFTLVMDEDGTILEITLPDGTKRDWSQGCTPLRESPEMVVATIVPFDILRTAAGLICVHQGCRKICF